MMECFFGDGEEDFVRSCWDFGPAKAERASAMLEAYVGIRPLRPGYRERFVVNMLRDCLLIWNHHPREDQGMVRGRSFVAWASPYLELNPFA